MKTYAACTNAKTSEHFVIMKEHMQDNWTVFTEVDSRTTAEDVAKAMNRTLS